MEEPFYMRPYILLLISEEKRPNPVVDPPSSLPLSHICIFNLDLSRWSSILNFDSGGGGDDDDVDLSKMTKMPEDVSDPRCEDGGLALSLSAGI